jgi:hypothetical protein
VVDIDPILVLNLLTAFEAYLWLAPPKNLPVSLPHARFLGARLGIYLVAVVAQMLLLEACKSTLMTPMAAMARKREYWRAALLYGSFALAFGVRASVSDRSGRSVCARPAKSLSM